MSFTVIQTNETLDRGAVDGGLTDPVFGSQAIFRAAMDAYARPGTIAEFGALVSPPPGLVPAAAAFLAAMADLDTPVWLDDPTGADRAAAAWLAFQTGAPLAAKPEDAAFVVLRAGEPAEGWRLFAVGTPDYPDRSATLLLPVDDLSGGTPLLLEGPGIETVMPIAPAGLPGDFLPVMAGNHARFPLGFDLLLVCGTQALALPRTTRLREA